MAPVEKGIMGDELPRVALADSLTRGYHLSSLRDIDWFSTQVSSGEMNSWITHLEHAVVQAGNRLIVGAIVQAITEFSHRLAFVRPHGVLSASSNTKLQAPESLSRMR